MNEESGCTLVFVVIARIGIPLLAGYWSWNWIEPDSFLGVLGFLCVWGIVAWLINLVIGAIIIGLFSNK